MVSYYMMRPCAFLYLISLSCAVLCCNPDWLSFDKRCYRGIQQKYDVILARRYCQILRGDLAVIRSNNTLLNIAQLFLQNSSDDSNNGKRDDSYWVHENSTLGGISSMSCSYIYSDEGWKLSSAECKEKKFFICEVEDEDRIHFCPQSWNLYGYTCYKTFKNPETYDQAVHLCELQRANLSVLNNIAKEHFAAAVIIGKKEVFLIGAKAGGEEKNGTTFKWLDGSPFDPSCSECRNNTPGECVGFSSDKIHPTMFTWTNLDCQAKHPYMCEMAASVRNVSASTTEPTTTQPPLSCPVGYNWKEHETSGICYWETTYEAERLNWFQARQFCQAYGGDLATYSNNNEENHGLGGAKGHYRGLWFGLKRGQDDVFRWVDNKTLSYSNWNYDQPNLKSETKFCVMHGPANSEWELDYCGVRRWFVCRAPKTREPKVPDTRFLSKVNCNFTGSSVYRNQWYLHDDYCYLVQDQAKYSWDTAKNFCQDNEAHMVSIHSFEETDFILRLLPLAQNTDLWIGLSAKGFDASLSWSDGSPLDFLYWAEDFNATASVDKCVIFDKQRGSWITEHCNRFLGVICKRRSNASYEFTTTEPTPRLPGNCEKGWYRFGNKCYKSFGSRWSQRETWASAEKTCKDLDSTQVSIHSEDEQNFITDLMLSLKASVWLGLEGVNRGTIFKWSDDSALDYTYWNVDEPMISEEDREFSGSSSSQQRTCVELLFDHYSMGKWSDVPCGRTRAFICQKLPNPVLTEPSEDPFECSDIAGWNKLGSSCYGIYENESQELTWNEAQAKCRTFDANLVNFGSSAVVTFLKRRVKNHDHIFWIGTRETKKFTYQSVTLSKSTVTNWLAQQPQRISETDNCVAMNSDGYWMVKNCKEKLPFICEWNTEVEETTTKIEEMNSCPSGSSWIDLGGDVCYHFVYVETTWNDAMFKCYKHGGQLASFHSFKEAYQVRDFLAKRHVFPTLSFHIGLAKRNDGSYAWIDHSPVDFTFWEEEQPMRSSMECVQLHGRTGKWRPVDCDDMLRNYICSIAKGNSENRISGNDEFLNSTGPTSDKIYKHETGHLTASIVGSTMGCLIILFILGGTFYFLKFRKPPVIEPTLLVSESL